MEILICTVLYTITLSIEERALNWHVRSTNQISCRASCKRTDKVIPMLKEAAHIHTVTLTVTLTVKVQGM
jgi:hypothetical protein